MPSITNTRRNGNVVTSELVDRVGIAERTYTFPDTTIRETLEISNESANNLIVSVGTQVDVIIYAFQSQTFTQSFTDFKMKAQTGHSSFRVRASYYESDEEDERTLDAQLGETAKKPQVGDSIKLGEAPRTLTDSISELAVNPKDYGVLGNGTQDDTANVQKVLNKGGKIHFPDGTYIISNGLIPVSNSIITGSKKAILKLKDGQDGTASPDLRNIFNLYNPSGIENVLIENITLDGNRDNVTNCYHCINIGAGSSKITIRDTYLRNPEYDAVYVGSGAKEVNISENFSFNAGRSHYVVTNASNVNIIGNKGIRAQKSYVDLESNVIGDTVDKVTVRDNVFIADTTACTAEGIGNTGPGTHKDITFENNYFYLNKRLGAFSGEGICDNVSFKKNTVYGKTMDASFFLDCNDTVRNVNIEDNKMFIDAASSGTGGAVRARNPECVKIKGNKIYNSKGVGITVDNPLNVISSGSVEDNEIYSPALDGIYVSANCIKTNKNKVKSSGRYGINITLQNGELSNNIIETPVNYGLYVYGCTNINMDNNKVMNPVTNGIYVHNLSKDIKGDGNKVYNSGAQGITLRNSSDIKLSNSLIVGSMKQGIYAFVDATNVSLLANTVKNSHGVGLDLYGSNIILIGNRAYDDQGTKTQTYGLWIRSGDYYTMSGNDFRGNLNGGIMGTCTNYKPSPLGTFATDTANFNFIS
ncbi:right-handed parallel beta-helix repeat-containing protein [Bacillus sp. ISL-4]|uniref:right-handed parallel beta-helix repeat-containing protein n=1 Tax=Bacillus sp. ISL-4 TaxID=2819125 RepID=UPI001BEC07A2|nr:right-handed parallel beta-helix repeat-containing protein [Bacillus sp. ISL-4]MBT2665597.1 right-handed parallel beta-helix repeat-containing protein [Bacillus sp. ISL-4]